MGEPEFGIGDQPESKIPASGSNQLKSNGGRGSIGGDQHVGEVAEVATEDQPVSAAATVGVTKIRHMGAAATFETKDQHDAAPETRTTDEATSVKIKTQRTKGKHVSAVSAVETKGQRSGTTPTSKIGSQSAKMWNLGEAGVYGSYVLLCEDDTVERASQGRGAFAWKCEAPPDADDSSGDAELKMVTRAVKYTIAARTIQRDLSWGITPARPTVVYTDASVYMTVGRTGAIPQLRSR